MQFGLKKRSPLKACNRSYKKNDGLFVLEEKLGLEGNEKKSQSCRGATNKPNDNQHKVDALPDSWENLFDFFTEENELINNYTKLRVARGLMLFGMLDKQSTAYKNNRVFMHCIIEVIDHLTQEISKLGCCVDRNTYLCVSQGNLHKHNHNLMVPLYDLVQLDATFQQITYMIVNDKAILAKIPALKQYTGNGIKPVIYDLFTNCEEYLLHFIPEIKQEVRQLFVQARYHDIPHGQADNLETNIKLIHRYDMLLGRKKPNDLAFLFRAIANYCCNADIREYDDTDVTTFNTIIELSTGTMYELPSKDGPELYCTSRKRYYVVENNIADDYRNIILKYWRVFDFTYIEQKVGMTLDTNNGTAKHVLYCYHNKPVYARISQNAHDKLTELLGKFNLELLPTTILDFVYVREALRSKDQSRFLYHTAEYTWTAKSIFNKARYEPVRQEYEIVNGCVVEMDTQKVSEVASVTSGFSDKVSIMSDDEKIGYMILSSLILAPNKALRKVPQRWRNTKLLYRLSIR